MRRGLTVNTSKSEVIHFNSRSCSSLPTFMYGDVVLPEKEQCKYLGTLVDKHINLKVHEKHTVRPYMASQQRIKEFAHEHDLKNRPHALIWLSKVYGIPAGMYACQVWGTEYLREGSEFKSHLQKRQLCSLRRFLGVKSTATNWPVLRECGQEPLQFYWFRATVKFFNNMLNSNSKTLCQVLKADLHLADMDESCWSAHVSKSFNGMRNEEVFKRKLLSASKIPMQDFLGDLRYRQQKVWREADALSPREVNRKAVTYHHWCGVPLNQTGRTPFCIPSYLFKDLDKGVMRNVSRFRLRAHCLKVESCKWLGGSNICDKCGCAEVQDEKHVLFYCNCCELCELRRKYKDLFIDLFKPLHTFAQLPNTDFVPFLASFHVVTNLEVNAFLNQDSYRFSKSLSQLVSIFDAG
uniref:Reverse transcriptase zinc-binding domain-containing protein n=1 Tax=Dunaliella tertiolecta TaxID=3047 RepID=A0A7S3VU70_DUNTE